LRAEAVDVIVVAIDAHDARAVNRGVEDLGGLEVRGNEDASVEALLRGLRSDGVSEITVEEQPTVVKLKRRAAESAVATTRSLKEREGKQTASFLK